ncbi:histidine phosphatase family protein [uncultured Schumannella sp.]|uniref:histidine phosphatase family protein n=1 Tax=uncultured Schumannella sp. TaxID=1195956 RepID=UPI0025F770D3|nr:histidine phosphatase family protein [uncultured Schumannella sp.]
MSYAFIRHGQTDWNLNGRLQGSSDIPLNDTGRAQAHEAAARLSEQRWDVIVSSPLQRARETAEIIAHDLGLELGPAYPGLVERDYGEVEGLSDAECRRRYPGRNYPGSESFAAVTARGRAALDQIAAEYGDREVIIVSHGSIIRYTLESIVGRQLESISNGAMSRVERGLDGGAWRVLSVNGAALVLDN